LKEDRRYLATEANRKPPSQPTDIPLDDYEMSKVMTRQPRNANNGKIPKRQVKGTKSAIQNDRAAISSNEDDNE